MPKIYIKRAVFILALLNLFFLSALVSFQITKYGEMVTIPDLSGKTLEEARTELNKLRLQVVQSGVELHDFYELGKIIAQEPEAEKKSRLNQVVKVLVSAGKEKVTVPRLTGRTLELILPTLQESRLRKGKVSHVHTSKYAAGKIISQFPPPDHEVGVNTRINLLVSQGEAEKKYLMPDLLGKRAALVIAKLKEMDFRVGDVRRTYYPGLEPGIIINQSPKQGGRIQKRNIIALEVSK